MHILALINTQASDMPNILVTSGSNTKTGNNDGLGQDKLPLNEEALQQQLESQRKRRVRRRNFVFLGLLAFIIIGWGAINFYCPCDKHLEIEEENPVEVVKQLGDYYGWLTYRPEQLHLSLGLRATEVYVTFATIGEVSDATVNYCRVDNSSDECIDKGRIVETARIVWPVQATDSKWLSITKGPGWRNLYNYRARMNYLEPGHTYKYQVRTHTKTGSTFYSSSYRFKVKDISNPETQVTLALYGDLGLINGQSIPRLTDDVDRGKYDAIIHNGDFAYDLDTHHGLYGDEFMRKIEPIAARVPYQVSVGNHEIAANFSYYDSRFSMLNSGGVDFGLPNNFYYSFNMGPVHFVAFSTEFYYFLDRVGESPLRNQYEWLIKDLENASSPAERALRPWIIVFGHRPMYCSSRSGDDCSNPNNRLRKGLPSSHEYALEKMFYDYGVDVELYSHEHQYERFLPLFDGKIYNGTQLDPYQDPRAPVHIISGSAGCQERLDPFIGTPVTGSVKQIADYGYTTLTASQNQLKFKQISDDQDGTVVDEFTITKRKQNFGKDTSN